MDKAFIIITVIIIIIIFIWTQFQCNYAEGIDNDDLISRLPIYVINLKDRLDRKLRTEATLNKYNLKATFVEAVNGRYLDLPNLLQKGFVKYDPKMKRYLRKGEIGCYMSHIKSWKLIQKSGVPYGMIFEDDITFVPNFRKKLNEILHSTQNIDWDIIYIGRTCYNNSDYRHRKECIVGEQIEGDLIYPGIVGYGNFAYIIKASSIDKILPYMFPIRQPIDVVLPTLYDGKIIKSIGLKKDIVSVVGNTDSDTYKIK